MPGGSLLMAGRCGVGRRTAVSVVSHMHGMQLFAPKVSRNYGMKQFKTDLKTVTCYSKTHANDQIHVVDFVCVG